MRTRPVRTLSLSAVVAASKPQPITMTYRAPVPRTPGPSKVVLAKVT